MRIILTIFLLLNSYAAFADTNEKSFTPDSILVPILEISLEGGGPIYECPGTGDECLVDIADPAALAALTAVSLAAESSIEVGSYTTLKVGNCKSEGSYDAKVRGAVNLGGTDYVTSSGAAPLTATLGDIDYATVTFSGCSSEYPIPGGLEVIEGEAVTINVFAALTNIAWGNLGTSTIPSGCVSNGSASVCLSYPDVVPSVGATSPALERYHISDDNRAANTAGGQILLIFDGADNLLGGFNRRFFSETSQETIGGFDTPFRLFSNNSDGTVNFENFGGSNDSSDSVFTDFQRVSHSGLYANPTNASTNYDAAKQ